MVKKVSTKIISYTITLICLILATLFVYRAYRINNFNDFQRSEGNIGISKFRRDNKVKCSDKDSYQIISDQFNDAMFYKTISVKQNTPYKVKCKVKTEGIETEEVNNAIRSPNFNK